MRALRYGLDVVLTLLALPLTLGLVALDALQRWLRRD